LLFPHFVKAGALKRIGNGHVMKICIQKGTKINLIFLRNIFPCC